MFRLMLFVVAASQIAIAQQTVNGVEGDCGFSKLKPIRITHYVQRSVVKKATPQYPLAAKESGVTGTVRIRVLINSRGLVERTCPEYLTAQTRPDRRLVIAAEAAALQWTFIPKFGLTTDADLTFTYAEDVLIFDFVLNEQMHSASSPKSP